MATDNRSEGEGSHMDAVKPLLFVDVDGVLSLFGFEAGATMSGAFHLVDGVVHRIPREGGERLSELAESFELVWATGWEEKANDYLPGILGLTGPPLPTLTFDGRVANGPAHWKLHTIDSYARARACAWIDDNLDAECEAWAAQRAEPTLLVPTDPYVGITREHVALLSTWAGTLSSTP